MKNIFIEIYDKKMNIIGTYKTKEMKSDFYFLNSMESIINNKDFSTLMYDIIDFILDNTNKPKRAYVAFTDNEDFIISYVLIEFKSFGKVKLHSVNIQSEKCKLEIYD